uniref:HEPN AbiU2-like domain-containing protein n=1 Tax=Caulobacter sp. (strain K31) TaxID=366602 RepID=B0T2A7_CAUSK
MASEYELGNLALYQGLMEEAKARALSINMLSNDQRGIPSLFVREYCFLQLRMLCEIIGLSCLVAHGDLVAKISTSLRKKYAPGEIIRALERLHSDFYPVPVIPQQTATGWHLGEYDDRPFLTKQELPDLWNKCGDVLHRGSLKKLVDSKTPIQPSFSDVNDWGQKVLNLLSAHRIVTSNGQLSFVTFLQVDQLGGAVQVVLGEASSV